MNRGTSTPAVATTPEVIIEARAMVVLDRDIPELSATGDDFARVLLQVSLKKLEVGNGRC